MKKWDQLVKEWLKPINYEDVAFGEAKKKHDELMEQNKIVYQALKNAGEPVKEWMIKEEPKRLHGLQAQKCFCEILWALEINHGSELKHPPNKTVKKIIENQEALTKIGFTIKEWITIKYKLEIKPDIYIKHFGTIEIKNVEPKEKIVNIKYRAWNNNPSTYLCVMKRHNNTFQFIGWLHGYQVFKLPYQPKSQIPYYPTAFYYTKLSKLHKPLRFMRKLHKVSSMKS